MTFISTPFAWATYLDSTGTPFTITPAGTILHDSLFLDNLTNPDLKRCAVLITLDKGSNRFVATNELSAAILLGCGWEGNSFAPEQWSEVNFEVAGHGFSLMCPEKPVHGVFVNGRIRYDL